MYYAEYAGRAPQFFRIDRPFPLESGGELPSVTLAYHTYGTLNETGDNAIWVCHALTANSDVADWWPGTVVEGGLLDPSKYFIVCANKLGSPYGSTSPVTENPATGCPWFLDFPQITVRDMVRAYRELRTALGIARIRMIIGGSTGGCQAMEWAIAEPELFGTVALTVTLPKTTPWIVADSEAQRMALEADPTFFEPRIDGGGRGGVAAALKRITARSIVMAVDTDIMFTEPEVREMAVLLGADYHTIHSGYGHDGFLIETPEITRILKKYL